MSVGVATADVLDELVFEDRQHPRVKDFLAHWSKSEMSERVVAKLALGVRSPRVEHPVHVPFVDASILLIDN